MYDEKTFGDYIFWLKVKRVVLIILFSVAGAIAGIAMSLLCTTGTAEKVQEGYWKMTMLRKLTIISKKLDVLVEENDNKVAGLLAPPKSQKSYSKAKKSTLKNFDDMDDDDEPDIDSSDEDDSDDQ